MPVFNFQQSLKLLYFNEMILILYYFFSPSFLYFIYLVIFTYGKLTLKLQYCKMIPAHNFHHLWFWQHSDWSITCSVRQAHWSHFRLLHQCQIAIKVSKYLLSISVLKSSWAKTKQFMVTRNNPEWHIV